MTLIRLTAAVALLVLSSVVDIQASVVVVVTGRHCTNELVFLLQCLMRL